VRDAALAFALTVTTDGRGDYLLQAIDSLRVSLDPWPEWRVVVDDSGDSAYGIMLHRRYEPDFTICPHSSRRGLAAAVRLAWTLALATPARYVFHAEDDFIYREPVDLAGMARLLDENPHLAQVVLKRQPWGEQEIAAGGQIEVAPDEYVDREGFVEHRRLFSFNPSLIRREAIELALAEPGDGLERGITDTLLAHGYSFAYYGARNDGPRCEHIGVRRSEGHRW
jgi:hypothetical protein